MRHSGRGWKRPESQVRDRHFVRGPSQTQFGCRIRPSGADGAGSRAGERLFPTHHRGLRIWPAGNSAERPGHHLRIPHRVGRGFVLRAVGLLPLCCCKPVVLPALCRRPAVRTQLLPLGGVLAVVIHHDRADCSDHRNFRRCRADGDLRRECVDDLVRLASREVRAARWRNAALHFRVHVRNRSVAHHRGLGARPRIIK